MTRRKFTKRMRLLLAATVLWGAVGLGNLLVPHIAWAGEIKKIAILTPEDPTDYGWNQQGFEAAKAVAGKYSPDFMPATGLG